LRKEAEKTVFNEGSSNELLASRSQNFAEFAIGVGFCEVTFVFTISRNVSMINGSMTCIGLRFFVVKLRVMVMMNRLMETLERNNVEEICPKQE
jgi:hypothetical protein